MELTKKIAIVNRSLSPSGYTIPDLGVKRNFAPRERREITFEELRGLYFAPGGKKLLQKYFVITDEEARKALFPHVEPEYYYDVKKVKELLTIGSMDAFLDCLDFAPAGVLDMIKELSVELEINDIKKRDAIFEKLNLDVTKAIEIKHMDYDGGDKAEDEKEAPKRRVNTEESATPRRRVSNPL